MNIEEQIKTYYITGFKIQDIYDEIGNRRLVDKTIKGFTIDIQTKRKKYLVETRKKRKNEQNNSYRGADNLCAAVKRQHIIDVNVLSAEKYYN